MFVIKKNTKFLKYLGWSLFTIFLALFSLIGINKNTTLLPRENTYLELDTISPHKPSITPKEYCASILKEHFGKIHCTTKDPRFLEGWDPEIQKIATEELQNSIKNYSELLEKIHQIKEVNSTLVEIESATQRKLSQLKQSLKNTTEEPHASQYQNTFNGLLISQGVSYNPYSNRFKTLPQNLAQYSMNQSSVKSQLKRLSFIANNLQYFFTASIILTFFLTRNKLSIHGNILASFYFLLIFTGLTITRDASLHFGVESPLFELNPFSQILERQLSITALSILLFVFSLLATKHIDNFINYASEKISLIKSTIILMLLTLMSYTIFGPAIGSETFKLSVCLISSTLLFKYGRPIEIAQEKFGIKKLIGQPFNSSGKINATTHDQNHTIELRTYFSKYISTRILFQIILVGFLMLNVAVIFSDLGGTLISACVFTFMLFILLGKKFGLALIAFFTILSILVFNISEKIQSRVQLMTEPMNANISDFARLIQFEQGAQPFGYKFGHIKWCSSEGNCVPLQSLSDYMPTLISGWIGRTSSLILLISFAITLLWLTYKCFISAWQNKDSHRYLKLFSASLCMASLFQLLATLMGNLRVIPLTGLGTPLISIGISSSITASIALGLGIGLIYKKE